MLQTLLLIGVKVLGGLLVAGVLLGVSIPLVPERVAGWGAYLVAIGCVAAAFALTRRRPPDE